MKKTAAPILLGILAITGVFPVSTEAVSSLGSVPNLLEEFGGADMFGPIPVFPYGNGSSLTFDYESDVFGPLPVFSYDTSVSDIDLTIEDSFLGSVPTFGRGFLGPVPQLQSDGSFE